MRKHIFAAALLVSTAPIAAQAHEPAPDPAERVSEDRLRTDVERLVAFGTRHTLSQQDDPQRGIGAAVDWGLDTFRAISADCGGCLTVVAPETTVEGRRIPAPTRLRNAVAIQRGTERPDEVVIIQGHIDSRASDVMDAASDAPGANDDGSGTALAIEAARVLSQRQYPVTIVYALLSGEEQGLYGGQLMADYAVEQGWDVKAVLNNDIVGNSCGADGYCEPDVVRVFSEGPRADLTDDIRAAQRRDGGENDSPSRNLARFIDSLADGTEGSLDVRQIWRVDRMGRGGDQIRFLEAGYPAVRFTVGVEDYDHQHQDLRTEDGTVYGDTIDEMDFAYLARVTQLNVRVADALARTPPPPAPSAQAAVRTDTLVRWDEVPGAEEYRIFQRRTMEPAWPAVPARVVGALDADMEPQGADFSIVLDGVRGDDWFFGVSACTADGLCSPVASAVPAGQFAPVGKEEGDE